MFDITHIFALIFVLTFNFVNGDQATNGNGLAISEIGHGSGFLDQNESCGCNVNGKMMTKCLMQNLTNSHTFIGSVNMFCDSKTGKCVCKPNIIGQKCDTCKEGYFSFDAKTKNGCLSCFCYGHTSQCKSSSGYVKSNDIHYSLFNFFISHESTNFQF